MVGRGKASHHLFLSRKPVCVQIGHFVVPLKLTPSQEGPSLRWIGEYGPRDPEEEHYEAWSLFQSHGYSGAWQGNISSRRLGDSTGPMQLSSSAQGMRSGWGEGGCSGPASLLSSDRMPEGRKQAMGARMRGMFLPATFVEEGPPFPAVCLGRAPSRQGYVTRQSSHPLALHLLALLPLHLPLPPLLRSHWGHQPLPGIWDRNR